MGIFKNMFDNWFDSNNNNDDPEINPATGLPMIDDSGIDVNGNPFGTDNDNFNNSDINNDDDFGNNNNDTFDNNGFNNSGLNDDNDFDSNFGDDDF